MMAVMPLTLTAIGPELRFTRRVDAYVPFDVELSPGTASDEVFYWRSTNAKYLLEIKIVASTGMIGAVSLVLVPREWVRIVDTVKQADHALTSDDGVPIVDVSPWKSKIRTCESGVDWAPLLIDEECPFIFNIGQDGIAILFDLGVGVSRLKNGDVNFLFTQDRTLCGITLLGLSSPERRLLIESYTR
jgi:hypothetical protein